MTFRPKVKTCFNRGLFPPIAPKILYTVSMEEGKSPKGVVPASQLQQCDALPTVHFIMIQMLTTKLQTVKDFFTEEEWDAIDSALADYQDYGEKETELMNSIGDKMYKLFNPKYQDENRHPASGAN